MKNLNIYINEAWGGVKKQSLKADMEAWCEEMGIKRYTINDKGEIDVNSNVFLYKKDFKELPYKFGTITGLFDIGHNPNLTSLKNCPNKIGSYFSCGNCPKLDSLEGCPNYVEWNFYCYDCKREFTEKEVYSLCKVRGKISI